MQSPHQTNIGERETEHKMPSESGERRPTRLATTGAQPPESEHHPCPRCDSTNTKFCYYNNYNLSQPRHFCKNCRRYWTRGGSLRNIPIGGGTRKSCNKRSRDGAATTTAVSSSSSSSTTQDPKPDNQIAMVPGFIKSEMGVPPLGVGVNLNEIAGPESGGFWAFGGFGLGFQEIGFGLGPPVWPMEQIGEVNGGGDCGGGGAGSGGSSGCNTWQMGGVDGGLADGDCFGWPDLSISTPGKCLK